MLTKRLFFSIFEQRFLFKCGFDMEKYFIVFEYVAIQNVMSEGFIEKKKGIEYHE